MESSVHPIYNYKMSLKSLNYIARNTIGSFLTSSPEDSSNQDEHELIAMACDMAMSRLKVEKIRGQNLLHSLPQLAAIIRELTIFMEEEADKRELSDSKECWNVFAMTIVHTALAHYYKKSETMKGKMD